MVKNKKCIWIDNEVLRALGKKSKPFETPNATFRRLLGLPASDRKPGRPRGHKETPPGEGLGVVTAATEVVG